MWKARFILAALIGIGSVSTVTSVSADVKLGALFPLSGELALLGEESFRGVELAIEEKNNEGGLKGENIRLVRGDAVDNNQAIGEARRLISVEQVKAIFGTYSSSRAVAASQVSELAGIPYFELVAVSDDITTRGFEYVFRTNPSSSDFGGAAITAVTDLLAPALNVDVKDLRIAIIHEDSVFGSSVSANQVATAKHKDLNIVQQLPYSASTVDMSSIILRLREAKIDVVLHTSYEKDTILFMQQAAEIGFQPKAVVGAGGGYILQPVADAIGHDMIEGTLVVAESHYDINLESAPGLTDFLAQYQSKYGSVPRSSHSLVSYVGAKALLNALEDASSLDAPAIRDAVYRLDIPNGGTAVGWGVKFNERGQNERAQMLVLQWQNGKLVTVYPESAAVGKFEVPH